LWRVQELEHMSTTYVPLISSGVAGPPGVLHLPRLWLKASLEARNKIAPGYPALSKGYDSMVLGALGLDTESVRKSSPSRNPPIPSSRPGSSSSPA